MSTSIAIRGAKIQEAIDIRDSIIEKDANFLGVIEQLLTDPQWQVQTPERREQVLRKHYAKFKAERGAILDYGNSRNVI